MIDLHGFVIFVKSLGTFVQTVSKVQDPMVLIGELVKVLNFYSNLGVAQHSNMDINSNARVASKNFWVQKARSN